MTLTYLATTVLWYDTSLVAGALKDQACLAPDLIVDLVREVVSHELFELTPGVSAGFNSPTALLHEYASEYEFYASYFPPTLFET
ncbi:hypothetical protein PINS_up016112, partial [Pythium insidiosum]